MFTEKQILKAGELGEISHIDVKHLIVILKENFNNDSNQLEVQVKPDCEYVTRVERAGRDTDCEWFRYQIQKLEEHIKRYGSKIEICAIDGDRIRMGCAFMEYGRGLRDPTGYLIVSKSV